MTSDDLQTLSSLFEKKFEISDDSFPKLMSQLEAHTGIFIQSGLSTYEFSHKTIQEFLAAEYLIALRHIPEDLDAGRQVSAELAMACAQSSNVDSYAVKLCKGHFLRDAANLEIALPFFKRLLVEEVKFDGEQYGLGLVLFLYTLAAFPGVHRSISLTSMPSQNVLESCFRDFEPSLEMVDVLLLGSLDKSASIFDKQAKRIHLGCSENFDVFEWRPRDKLDLGTFPAVFVPKSVSQSLGLGG